MMMSSPFRRPGHAVELVEVRCETGNLAALLVGLSMVPNESRRDIEWLQALHQA